VIKAGNIAAHEANMSADVALFNCGFLTGADELDHLEKLNGLDLETC